MAKTVRLLAFLLACLILCPHAAWALHWTSLEDGLELAEIRPQYEAGFPARSIIRALRIDPGRFTFSLHSSRWEGCAPLTLGQWAQQKGLVAAINASMFQIDGVTSTGYMREGKNINNSRIAARYGAFFVANPIVPGLPDAALLNRSHDDWHSLLPKYGTVVQNFRLMDRAGHPLWPKDGPLHAISAIAQTCDGHIVFLHCSDPVSIHAFALVLGQHPELDIKDCLYAEGGKEASLMVEQNGSIRVWSGMNPWRCLFIAAGQGASIPNVLGVRRKYSLRH